ncbi:MAG TPA: hypothetical protein VF198_04410 [Vicinamibacterales bacterium]
MIRTCLTGLLLAALLGLPGMTPAAPAAESDLDRFMARVLARRDENWRTLQQYVLDEEERASLTGPGGARLFGLTREYTWYIRDGIFVRSPVRFNGVALSEPERRAYEDRWISRERERAERRDTRDGAPPEPPPATDVDSLVRLTREPQFVSAAYFLRFRFEPGHYAFAGPDEHAGRRVLKIEYYPSRLFEDDEKASNPSDEEARLQQQFNKVALVTLWVEPDSHQIVRYVFENLGFVFLPGRWLVRVDGVRALMEMGQPFPGVWLPERIEGRGSVTLASGTYDVHYAIRYHDYREAEVKAKVR